MSDLTLLDPAMLGDPPDDESGSDWEYEYHESETETFYLTLDLSSLHGPLRPPRRPNHTPKTSVAAEETDFSRPVESTEAVPDETAEDRLQILGLHSGNPLVAHQNQIFSCAWADQVGTELLLTPPDEIPDTTATPLARGKDYDLVAANRVKILGHKANLISGSEPSAAAAAAASLSTSAATSTAATASPGTAAKPTNQAHFLDRLAGIKQARGEFDPVRTVFSTRRTQNVEDRLRGWARTEEQMADIQRLQEGVLRGDPQAVTELESLGFTD